MQTQRCPTFREDAKSNRFSWFERQTQHFWAVYNSPQNAPAHGVQTCWTGVAKAALEEGDTWPKSSCWLPLAAPSLGSNLMELQSLQAFRKPVLNPKSPFKTLWVPIFWNLLKQPVFSTGTKALILSQWGYPTADVPQIRLTLERLAQRAQSLGARRQSEGTPTQAMMGVPGFKCLCWGVVSCAF